MPEMLADDGGETIPAAMLQYSLSKFGTRPPVSEWSFSEKLGSSIERALAHLPEETAHKLQSMLSKESLDTVEVVSAAWLASHLVGIGELVDGAFVAGGLVSMGGEVIHVGQDLYAFAAGTHAATTEEGLDAAGAHLARAIATVGVDAAAALLTHKVVSTVKSMPPPSPGPLLVGELQMAGAAPAIATDGLLATPAVALGIDFLAQGPDSSLRPLDSVAAASLKRASKVLPPEVAAAKAKALPRIEAFGKRLIERLDAQLASGRYGEQSRANIEALRNGIHDHHSAADLTGALRDNLEMPVRRRGSGEVRKHFKEVTEPFNGINQTIQSLRIEFDRTWNRGAPNSEVALLIDDLVAYHSQVMKFIEPNP